MVTLTEKWIRPPVCNSWTRLFAFLLAMIPFRKVWIQLFCVQLWRNKRADSSFYSRYGIRSGRRHTLTKKLTLVSPSVCMDGLDIYIYIYIYIYICVCVCVCVCVQKSLTWYQKYLLTNFSFTNHFIQKRFGNK